jgi:uncharacterized damage-inducible protein DinB
MPKPDLQKVPSHLRDEINLVKQDNLHQAFLKHKNAISFLRKIPKKKWEYRYAEGKWNIKELVQHVIDAERIFCYRALVIARKDKTAVPSFDENEYGASSKAQKRTKKELIKELKAVQKASTELFESFDEEQLQTIGNVSNYSIDVNAIGFVILGHTLHHIKILKERYLLKKDI